jgi:hypothetical protein
VKTVAHTMCSCGKRGFDERVVDKALGRAQAKRRRQMDSAGTRRGTHMENRTYPCEVGDLHHLTSESRREYQTRTIPTLTWDQFQTDQRRYAA